MATSHEGHVLPLHSAAIFLQIPDEQKQCEIIMPLMLGSLPVSGPLWETG